jgi:hypothetical protein
MFKAKDHGTTHSAHAASAPRLKFLGPAVGQPIAGSGNPAPGPEVL